MDLVHLVIVFVAGIAVAFINTISAAGSLVSLSALMFVGLSPIEANATNRVPILFQSFFSVKGFESKGVKGDNLKWWLAFSAVPGAILGALLAVRIPGELFNHILLGVMVFFLLITILNPLKKVKNRSGEEREIGKHWGVLMYLVIGIYGGFIQAGSGFFLLSPLLIFYSFDIHKANYYKVFITLIFTVAAFAVFFFKGNINWYYGLVMSAGASLGGWLTSRWSVTLSDLWMRRIMVVIISSLALYVWLWK